METEMTLSWLSDLGKSVFGSMDGLFSTLVAKKIAIFALVSLSSVIDRFLLGSEDVLRTVTTVFYIANEAMSIMENVGKVGLPLPQKLQNFLSHFEKYQGSRK